MATSSSTGDRTEAVSVLVVDDDPLEARFVSESLELADPAVAASKETDPDAALAAIAEGGVDCVITDATLGDLDGFDFLDRVAQTDASVRAVVHTAEDDPDVAREAWNRGAAYARKDPELDRYDVLARHILGHTDQQ